MKTDWKKHILYLKEIALSKPKLPSATGKYILSLSDNDYDEATNQIGGGEYAGVIIQKNEALIWIRQKEDVGL